ncbi:Imm45 family immunity protein [Asaia astilbis]|uniref:Imm45 family immunity protein n=1 Tax=Asaia astilbis TaxID=610244 RepID=UPI000472BDD4|nr:Imm45 family immunity protein [Asaia astilbis]
MFKFEKLINLDRKFLRRGNVFRLPAKYPYESKVDFMICESDDSASGYGLIVTTGYKAGKIFQYLPAECLHIEHGISTEWVILNWNKWIYMDCLVGDVFLSEGYNQG